MKICKGHEIFCFCETSSQILWHTSQLGFVRFHMVQFYKQVGLLNDKPLQNEDALKGKLENGKDKAHNNNYEKMTMINMP